MNKYVFKEYDPVYKEYFKQEKKYIQTLLGEIAEVEHIGSTAIEGLGGKGIIDILAGISEKDFVCVKKILEDGGYEYREVASVPGRLFFRRDYTDDNNVRRVHVHLVELGSIEWKDPIFFRDYLTAHPQKVSEYSNIKQEAVKKAEGDGIIYKKLKEVFIQKVMENSREFI